MTQHIPLPLHPRREFGVAFDFMKERGGVVLEQPREEVKPPAVRHGEDYLGYTRYNARSALVH